MSALLSRHPTTDARNHHSPPGVFTISGQLSCVLGAAPEHNMGQKRERQEFPTSQESVTEDGRRWRKCVGVAVVNSIGQLLVGQRIKIEGAWNCPQGGMDAESKRHGGPEMVVEAAAREAYEECGLVVGKHIAPLAAMSDADAVCYEAGGWLKAEGYAGQQLHWVLFACCSAMGDADANAITTLSGLAGEPAEFSQVRWQPIDDVVEGIWPAKRAPYEALRRWIAPLLAARLDVANSLDFSGVWARDASQNVGVEEGLVARGMGSEAAAACAKAPYVQEWSRGEEPGAWVVATFAEDLSTPRRCIEYPIGDWEESFTGGSMIFGPGQDALLRRTSWLPEPRAQGSDAAAATAGSSETAMVGASSNGSLAFLPLVRVAHTTWTTRVTDCAEISVRYLRSSCLVLERTLLTYAGNSVASAVVSEEVFVRRASL